MAAYADFVYYVDTYQGTAIAQADFPGLAMRASAVIDQLTYNRSAVVIAADTDDTTIDRIMMATCAVADEMQKIEASGGTVSSERVGNISVTYLSQQSEGARLKNAAALFLWPTELMYAGFASDE